MKTYFTNFTKVILASVTLVFTSCEKEGPEDEQLESNSLTANLSECMWASSNIEDENATGLFIDFSDQNIHVYDQQENIVDEGNWRIENEKIVFDGLSQRLGDYNGSWTVIEDREGYLKLQIENTIIDFEQSCQ